MKRSACSRQQLKDDIEPRLAAWLLAGLSVPVVLETLRPALATTGQASASWPFVVAALAVLGVGAALLPRLAAPPAVDAAPVPLAIEDDVARRTSVPVGTARPPDPPSAPPVSAPPSLPDVPPVDLSLEDLILDAVGRLPEQLADIRDLDVTCVPEGDPCDLRGSLSDPSLIPVMLRSLASALKDGGVDPTLFQPLPGGPADDDSLTPFAIRLSQVPPEERGDASALASEPEPTDPPPAPPPAPLAALLDDALVTLTDDLPRLDGLWSECEAGGTCEVGGDARSNEEIATWMTALAETLADDAVDVTLTTIADADGADGAPVKEFSLLIEPRESGP